ncbi:MAG: APC family permease [Planctomycetota bacterium]
MTDSTRRFSTRSLTLLVIASMIGAGVYTTSGFALADLGSPIWVMVAWMIGGLIAICGAIAYGGLAQSLCESGGEYLYLSRFAHPVAGFIAGWVSLLAGFTSAGAFAAIAFAAYAVPNSNDPNGISAAIIAVGLVMICMVMHGTSVHHGLLGQDWLVMLKLLTLGVFLVSTLALTDRWHGFDEKANTQTPSFAALLTSVMWVSLSYCGFNASIYVAGASEKKGMSVARSLWLGTVIVTAIYLALNVVFMFAPSNDVISGEKDIATITADVLGGNTLASVIRVAICLGLASSVSSVLLTGPKVYQQMATDGLFPQRIASPNNRSSPRRLVVFQGVAMIVVILVADLRSLLSYLSLTLSLSAAATVATLWLPELRRHQSTTVLFSSSVFIAATLTIAIVASWRQPGEALAAMATLVSGVIAYFIVKRPSAQSNPF